VLALALIFAGASFCQTPAAHALSQIAGLMEQRNYTEAMRVASAALATDPRNAELLNARGAILADQNQLTPARRDFEQAVRLNPGLVDSWRNLARVCQSLPDSGTCAPDAWRHVLNLRPADGEARFSLAALYERQKKYRDSIQEIQRLPADEITRPQAQVLLSADLAALGRFEDAQQAATRAVSSSEFSAADVRWLIPRLVSPEAAPLMVSFVEALTRRGEASVEERRHLVSAYESLGRWKDARTVLEALALDEPRNPDHLFELARVAYEQRDFEGGLGYLGHARDLRPDDARVHFLFGMMLTEMNLPFEARKSLEKAVDLAPDNPDYRYALGLAILRFQNPSPAIECFEKYLQARPGDARGRFALGVAYFQTSEFAEAAKLMHSVLDDQKTEAGAAYYLGRIAYQDQQLDEAASFLERSIRALPSFAQAYIELARVRLEQGRETDARAAVDQALKLQPDDFQANTLLLGFYHRAKDPRAAALTARLRQMDERRSKESELMLRGVEVKPY
jgi:tetratricopeptide (TPR) repeat protein